MSTCLAPAPRRSYLSTTLVAQLVLALWMVIVVVQIQRVEGDQTLCSLNTSCPSGNQDLRCPCYQYYNEATSKCVNCTKCCRNGKFEVATCSPNSDAVCSPCDPSTQFFNNATQQCQECTECSRREQMLSACTIEHDTVCDPRCQPHQYYSEGLNRCFFDCDLCPMKRCLESSEPTKCRCFPEQCYSPNDLLCRNNICTDTEETTEKATATVNKQSNNLPAWGIGLISIGVVIAIVAFSVGSMILSFCTRKTPHTDLENEPGVNSKTDLNGRYQPSARLHPHLFNKGNKYGYYPPGSLTRTGSLRGAGGGGGGGGRGGSIRGISKPPTNLLLTRSDNATPI